jgi:ribosomal protein L40E
MLKKLVILICAVIFGGTVMAQKYIGAEKCKMCHNKKDKGEQYNKWAATAHANSMNSLTNAKSMAWAKANNVAAPAKEAKCLKCHATSGSVAANLLAGITQEEGVSCESCHGPGSGYKASVTMKNKELSMEKGLINPTKEVCLKCHAQSADNPFNKPFDFATYITKVTHPAKL